MFSVIQPTTGVAMNLHKEQHFIMPRKMITKVAAAFICGDCFISARSLIEHDIVAVAWQMLAWGLT